MENRIFDQPFATSSKLCARIELLDLHFDKFHSIYSREFDVLLQQIKIFNSLTINCRKVSCICRCCICFVLHI